MKTEELMDAIGLLPADLIAAADGCRRNTEPKIIRWRRWVPVAACLAVLIAVGYLMRTEAPMRLGAMYQKSEAAVEAPAEMVTGDTPAAEEAVNGTGMEGGCPREDGAVPDAEPEKAMTHPMTLTLSWGEEPVTVTPASFTIVQDNPDGSREETTACGPHPLDADLEPIGVEAEQVRLSWPETPDVITVRRWARNESQPETVLPEDGVLTLDSAYPIYEITAIWDSRCTASYAVHLICVE